MLPDQLAAGFGHHAPDVAVRQQLAQPLDLGGERRRRPALRCERAELIEALDHEPGDPLRVGDRRCSERGTGH
jgi:hypothetical protein